MLWIVMGGAVSIMLAMYSLTFGLVGVLSYIGAYQLFSLAVYREFSMSPNDDGHHPN